jgi:hypothetical protein
MTSIQINLWLQDAIELKLGEHVRNLVRKRDNLEERVFIEIYDTFNSGGFIDVKWSYQANYRGRKTGFESFTLAEVLRICMTDERENLESKVHPKELKEFNPKYKIGESVVFTHPYFEGSEPQTYNVVIIDSKLFGDNEEIHYLFSYENNKGGVWYPESKFSYRP